MLWVWAAIVVAFALAGGAAEVVRRQRRAGWEPVHNGRLHYRVWGFDRATGSKCTIHVDATSPRKAEEVVDGQGVRVEGVIAARRQHKTRRRNVTVRH